MTTPPIPEPLVTRVEVTSPTGRVSVSRESLEVLDCRHPWHDGWSVRPVRGYDTPLGFVYAHNFAT
jgi:hypothetical protein